jgi:predicted ester cyclase
LIAAGLVFISFWSLVSTLFYPAAVDAWVVMLNEKGEIKMSTENNKAIVRYVYELCTRKDVPTLFEQYDPGYIEHTRNGDISLEQLKQSTSMFFTAFPDSSFTVENMVAEGDKVAYQVTIKGTHKGLYMGIAPTGNKIEMRDTSIKRIVNGKLAESWGTLDSLSMMQQLDMIPKR